MNWHNLCAVKENVRQRNSAFLKWRTEMLIQTTYGRWCCELEKSLSVYLQRQSKKSIFHNVQLTLQKSNLYFVQRKSFSYRKSSYFKHSTTNKEFLEEHPEKTRSQVRFVSIAGRSGGQVSCTDGLKSIQQEPSFQSINTTSCSKDCRGLQCPGTKQVWWSTLQAATSNDRCWNRKGVRDSF